MIDVEKIVGQIVNESSDNEEVVGSIARRACIATLRAVAEDTRKMFPIASPIGPLHGVGWNEACENIAQKCESTAVSIETHQAFINHLEHASNVVGTWPDWKQKLLGNSPTNHRLVYLIERSQPEGQFPALWWCGLSSKENNWTENAAKAKAYSTRELAEEELESLSDIKGVHSQFGHVTEHIFIDSAEKGGMG